MCWTCSSTCSASGVTRATAFTMWSGAVLVVKIPSSNMVCSVCVGATASPRRFFSNQEIKDPRDTSFLVSPSRRTASKALVALAASSFSSRLTSARIAFDKALKSTGVMSPNASSALRMPSFNTSLP